MESVFPSMGSTDSVAEAAAQVTDLEIRVHVREASLSFDSTKVGGHVETSQQRRPLAKGIVTRLPVGAKR